MNLFSEMERRQLASSTTDVPCIVELGEVTAVLTPISYLANTYQR